jgi:glycosyltransferase involved in cell wall biosynthesis
LNEDGDAPLVEILLSTHNGARHLSAFLNSLSAQTYPRCTLTVRDDGSSDGTVAILEDWRDHHDLDVSFVDEASLMYLGVVRSFSKLLQASSAPYVMLADQDDVWLPDKVKLTLEAMRAAEGRGTSPLPVLAHTDLTLVDDGLNVVGDSLWRHQGLSPPRRLKLPRLMIENVVWGCTAMLNRSLVEMVGELPEDLDHHDWWIALVAAAFGRIVSLPERPILWRRHGSNESEISCARDLWRSALGGPEAARARLRRVLDGARERVSVFVARHGSELPPEHLAAARAFLALPTRGPLARRYDILRHGFLFGSAIRNAGLLALA